VQNQSGNHPLRWDKRVTVVEYEGFDQYQVSIDGSRRLTRRNRKYLRLSTSFHPNMSVNCKKACCGPPLAVAVTPAIAKPASKQQPSRSLTGQGQHQEQCHQEHGHRDQQHQAGAQHEENVGYVYKPLQIRLTNGTVTQ
jgi:hypothetical protein